MPTPDDWPTLLQRILSSNGAAEVFEVVEPYLEDGLRADPALIAFPFSPNVGYAVALLTEQSRTGLEFLSAENLIDEAVHVMELPGGATEEALWPIFMLADSVTPEQSFVLVDALLERIDNAHSAYIYDEIVQPQLARAPGFMEVVGSGRLHDLVRRHTMPPAPA